MHCSFTHAGQRSLTWQTQLGMQALTSVGWVIWSASQPIKIQTQLSCHAHTCLLTCVHGAPHLPTKQGDHDTNNETHLSSINQLTINQYTN